MRRNRDEQNIAHFQKGSNPKGSTQHPAPQRGPSMELGEDAPQGGLTFNCPRPFHGNYCDERCEERSKN